ncbi:hypothetical protein NL526_28965, partial [Klebsiella pneumoniae]|nr:hypothetical protein [Klebsiella pneumoniae]
MEITDGKNTHTALEPVVYQPGVQSLVLKHRLVESHRPSRGGFLTHYLVKPAFDLEKKDNPQANANQVWGWLPPPLVG